MKSLILLLLSALTLHAASGVTISWNPNTETDVVSYRVYLGNVSGTYLTNYSSTTTNLQLLPPQLLVGTNYIVVTAVNSAGFESAYSAEVHFNIPAKPSGVKFSLQASPSPTGPWNEVTNLFVAADLSNPKTNTFYRGQLEIQ